MSDEFDLSKLQMDAGGAEVRALAYGMSSFLVDLLRSLGADCEAYVQDVRVELVEGAYPRIHLVDEPFIVDPRRLPQLVQEMTDTVMVLAGNSVRGNAQEWQANYLSGDRPPAPAPTPDFSELDIIGLKVVSVGASSRDGLHVYLECGWKLVLQSYEAPSHRR